MTIDSAKTRRTLQAGGRSYDYYSLHAAEELGLRRIGNLPYSMKVLVENALRQHAEGLSDGSDLGAIVQWLETGRSSDEMGFRPARVLMPDSSGLPLFGDLAAMRDAIVRLGGDPRSVNPAVPIDFVVDHAVMVDEHGTSTAVARNYALELKRNAERYAFLRWASQAFDQVRLIPPLTGILHQINVEYLARVVWSRDEGGRTLAYPDTLLGMDSHTAMVNGLGVLGWGVGGLEGGTAAIGETISIPLPEVVGCRLVGAPRPGVTTTDVVLTVTQILRRADVVAKFVEYFGPGLDQLTVQARSTIANMTPEYGANVGIFPIDAETLRYLRLSGRDEPQVQLVEAYAKAQGLWRDASTPQARYTDVVEIDLSAVEPSVSGPKRPQDRVALAQAPSAFAQAFPPRAKSQQGADGAKLGDGDVVIAAISSCTNAGNPEVIIAAGLLARNAVARGLKSKPWVKTSLSPASRVVADYLELSGLQKSLDALGFQPVGFGCMTCAGFSGPLPDAVAQAIERDQVTAVAVVSSNRNFEGRVHPLTRAAFLASPPLVVAYAIAGSVLKDLENEPLGHDPSGRPVYLRDIWPSKQEIDSVVRETLTPERFRAVYADALAGTAEWRALEGGEGMTFDWKAGSTFIRRPPFFDDMQARPAPLHDIRGARILGLFGDTFTTDHISPVGTISPGTSAAAYLQSLDIAPRDFVSFAARRLNHDVMIRGTFANIRVRNEMAPNVEGGYTTHQPSGEAMSIHDAAVRYHAEGVPLVVVAGSDYGAGSSRDWAAKGTSLLGVRAVVAESFERIHRSNLVGMGVMPLEFPRGVTRKTLGLDGTERIDVIGIAGELAPRRELACTITRSDGMRETLRVICRLDTRQEVEYYRHGGILHHVLRERLKETEVPA